MFCEQGMSYCGVVIYVLECNIEINEFELQSHNYIYFRTKTSGKIRTFFSFLLLLK